MVCQITFVIESNQLALSELLDFKNKFFQRTRERLVEILSMNSDNPHNKQRSIVFMNVVLLQRPVAVYINVISLLKLLNI